MKSSKQIADYVLKQRDEYEERKKIISVRIKRVTYACSSLCAAILMVVGVHKLMPAMNKVPDMLEPVTTQTTVVTTVYDDNEEHTESNNMTDTSESNTENQPTDASQPDYNNIPPSGKPGIFPSKPIVTAPASTGKVTTPVNTASPTYNAITRPTLTTNKPNIHYPPAMTTAPAIHIPPLLTWLTSVNNNISTVTITTTLSLGDSELPDVPAETTKEAESYDPPEETLPEPTEEPGLTPEHVTTTTKVTYITAAVTTARQTVVPIQTTNVLVVTNITTTKKPSSTAMTTTATLPWNDLPVYYKFNEFTYSGANYTSKKIKVNSSDVGDYIDTITISAVNYNNLQIYYETVKIYGINGNPWAVAVKFDNSNYYYQYNIS